MMLAGAKAIATYLGVSPARLRTLVLRHDLPVALVAEGRGRRYLASTFDLDAWIKSKHLRTTAIHRT